MSSRKLEDLTPDTKRAAVVVVNTCAMDGFDLLIYCTLRSLEEQAKLFRQSRTLAAIELKMRKFDARGFGYLSAIIEDAGACSGPHVTNAAPGESWHNYAEAWDAVPVVNGKLIWKYADAPKQWQQYGQAVRDAGLEWAGDWTRFKERAHAQLRKGSNPLKVFSADEIEHILIQNGLLNP